MNESPQGLSKHIIRPIASLLVILLLTAKLILASLSALVFVLALPICCIVKLLELGGKSVKWRGHLRKSKRAGAENSSFNSMTKEMFGALLRYTSQFLWCLMFPIFVCTILLGCTVFSPVIFSALLVYRMLPYTYFEDFFSCLH